MTTRTYFHRPGCHLHCFRVGEGQWETHLLLRDYLRENADARDRYAGFKRETAKLVGWNRVEYVERKQHFVDALIAEARRRPV